MFRIGKRMYVNIFACRQKMRRKNVRKKLIVVKVKLGK
jgi:hypothetical protein